MKVKMLKTQRGAPDGIHIQTYLEGNEYELNDALSTIFLKQKWAVEVKPIEVKSEIVPENKMETAPMNKEDKRKKK